MLLQSKLEYFPVFCSTMLRAEVLCTFVHTMASCFGFDLVMLPCAASIAFAQDLRISLWQ